MIVITGSVFQLVGPLSGVQGNSVYYSGMHRRDESTLFTRFLI